MKFTLRGVSGAALMFGLAGVGSANAQEAQTVPTNTGPMPQATTSQAKAPDQAAPQKQETPDKVVVTGSLIATTSKDQAKPVEVYTAQDLQEQGAPSVSEFVRSLSVSYGSNLGFGQATPEVPTGSGFTSADIRGLGPNATLTLVNGRRAAAANGGFGADLNTVPVEALGAVDILKDGASSIYGAGAVGGVINFQTRRDIKAPQLTVDKSFYKDGDGNLKIQFLDGWVGDSANLLITYGHEHEGAMLQNKRDYANLPFAANPAEWSLTAANPGGFNNQISPFLAGATIAGTTTPIATPATATFGATVLEDLRSASDCTAIGGQIANVIQTGARLVTTAANNGCAFPQASLQDIVSDTTVNRAYVEFNADVNDHMQVRFNVTYSKNEVIDQRIPSDPPTARSTDGQISASCATSAAVQFGCYYVIPVQVNTYTTPPNATTTSQPTATATRNPFISDFMSRTGLTTATLPDTGALYTAANYRPFLFGGSPFWGNGLRHDKYDRERILVNAGMKGELSDSGILGLTGLGKLFAGIGYDFNGQYDQYQQTNATPDIFVARLQNALLGYGGPSCSAIDRVPTDYSSAANYNRTVGIQSDTAPGTNGCQWFNPFASAWTTSLVNGAANPQFNAGAIPNRAAGYQNPRDLVDWMTGDKTTEDLYQTGTFDFTLTGELPKALELPGGPIGWAAGTQWRVLERRSMLFDRNQAERFLDTQRCPYPDISVVDTGNGVSTQEVGSRGCPTAAGAFYGTGVANITLNNVPIFSDSQVLGTYAELKLPVLDNLNFDISGRHEEYNGGSLKGTIYNISGKYDITPNLYIRASYGTNFRADAALDLHPGQQTFTNPAVSRFGNINPTTITEVNSGIGPENDVTQNYGIAYTTDDFFGGRLRLGLDYWQVEINGQVATTSSTIIFNNVFGRNDINAVPPNIASGAGGSQNNRDVVGIPNTATANSSGQFANCGAALIQFVKFGSPCVTGVTRASDISEVDLFQQNGPGFTTNGLDYSFDYSHELFDGYAGVSLTATENLVYKASGFDVNGVPFQIGTHNLGYANFSKTGGIPSSRWKANAALRWSNSEHNINFRANLQTGVKDERYEANLLVAVTNAVAATSTTPAIPAVYSTLGVFPKTYMDFDLVYIYTPKWAHGFELRGQVLNVFDRNPLLAQFRSGYFNGFGDPRGRIIEVALTKKF